MMRWEYNIKELDRHNFEIEYNFYGLFGKLKDTIIRHVKIIPPKDEFFHIYRSSDRVIHSDVWSFVSEFIFGIEKRDECRYTYIVENLEEVVKILDDSKNQLKYSYDNFIKNELPSKQKLLKRYIEEISTNPGAGNPSFFFKEKIQNDFSTIEEKVENELWQKIYAIWKRTATNEFDRKYNKELSLYNEYIIYLDRLKKWDSFLPLFYNDSECYNLTKKNNYISEDQKKVYYKGPNKRILKKDIPERKFYLVCNQPLGPIKEDTIFCFARDQKESILIYEGTVIWAFGKTVFHIYSINENYGQEKINEDGVIQHDAYTVLFKNFNDCRLDKIDADLTGLSACLYQLVHKDWTSINKFVASYHSLFNEKLNNWHPDKIFCDIFFHLNVGIKDQRFWNNRILELTLSDNKTTLIHEYSEEVYDNRYPRYCKFINGNLIENDLYYDCVIDGELIYNVSKLKQKLKDFIVSELRYNDVLEEIQKIRTDFWNKKYTIFNIESARQELNQLWKNNLSKFLHADNKNYFLQLFINDLFNKNVKEYIKERQVHQFVISKTKDAENAEFGKLAEREVYSYLSKHFDHYNWSNEFMLPVDFFEAFKLEIIWKNKSNESYLPYDICIKSELYEILIDVKATRGEEGNIFYVSISELKKVLEAPDLYVIARVSLIEEGKKIVGIQLNSEMNLNFFRFKDETIQLIKNNISEWEDYYGEKSIRFLTSHFEQNIAGLNHEITLNDKCEQYYNSYQKVIENYFNGKVNETKNILRGVTNYYSKLLEDPSLEKLFNDHRSAVVSQLCMVYRSQFKEYKVAKPK